MCGLPGFLSFFFSQLQIAAAVASVWRKSFWRSDSFDGNFRYDFDACAPLVAPARRHRFAALFGLRFRGIGL
jgi:hypothetical protein